MSIFEQATRQKVRFQTTKGTISVEDLWDLSAQALDAIYKSLAPAARLANEDSLLATPSKADETLALQIELVKHIFGVKQAEAEARKTAAANAQRKQQLLTILERKEEAALEGMSAEEIQQMIASLG